MLCTLKCFVNFQIDNDIPEVNVTIDPKLAQEKGNAILQLQKADGSSGVKEVDLYIKNGNTLNIGHLS